MAPDTRAPEETYAQYVEALSQIFVPRQESDMAKLDYKKCKQARTEAIQIFHGRKVRLFMDAFRVDRDNIQAWMEPFLDDYLDSIVRREVKMDLLEHKPYATPEEVLTRAMTSSAKHRALIPDGAPTSAFDGLFSTNHYNSTAVGSQRKTAGAAEPMEIGMFETEQEEDLETTLASLSYREAAAETDVWEDPATQSVVMAIEGKETRACFSCSKVGHLKRDCWRRPRNQSMAARNRAREQSTSQGWKRGG